MKRTETNVGMATRTLRRMALLVAAVIVAGINECADSTQMEKFLTECVSACVNPCRRPFS